MTKSGNKVPISLTLIPFTEKNNEQSIICNIFDMTEIVDAKKVLAQNKKELEQQISERSQQLIDSEKRYFQFYHNSPDMHASVDPETAIIQQCNQTLIDTLGYKSIESIVGKSIFEIYHHSSMDKVKEAFKHFQSTGNVENTELNLRTAKGTAFPVILKVNSIKDDNGKIISSISSWRDASEFKSLLENKDEFAKAEKLYKKNEELYNTVLSSISDGSWDWHLETGNMYISSNFKELLGYTEDELYNHISTWEKLCFDNEFIRFKQAVDNCLTDNE